MVIVGLFCLYIGSLLTLVGACISNAAMAPCVIWHTPLRVKIAANLPHELRAEIKGDEAFVQVDSTIYMYIYIYIHTHTHTHTHTHIYSKEHPQYYKNTYNIEERQGVLMKLLCRTNA